LRIDIYHHFEADNAVLTLLTQLNDKVTQMALDVTKLQAAVQAEDTVIDSAVTLINGLPQLVGAAVQAALAQAGVDTATAQAAVDAVTADVSSKTAGLTAALTANTPTPPVTP